MNRLLRVLVFLLTVLVGLSLYANVSARSIPYIPLQDNVLKASSALGLLSLGLLLFFGGWILLKRPAQHGRTVRVLAATSVGGGAVCLLLAVILAASNWSNGSPVMQISTPTVKWVFKTNRGIYSRPVVAEDLVYFGSAPGGLYALDRQSGQQRWHFAADNSVDSDPVITREKVYFGTYGGAVHGLDYLTGREIWQYQPEAYGMLPCPTISDNTMYVAGCIWAGVNNELIAIDLAASTEKWRYRPEQPVLWRPALAGKPAFVTTSKGSLQAIDANTTEVRWTFQVPNVEFTPAEVSGGEVYVRGSDGNFYAVDIRTGQEKWRIFTQPQNGVPVPMTLTDNVAYFGVRNYLYVVDVRNHELLWQYRLDQNIMTAPAVANGVVYVGTRNGPLYALDMTARREKWRFEAGGDVISTPVVVDGVVYFGSMDGNFYAVQ